MITIFGDFRLFSAKKWAFFSKPNVMILLRYLYSSNFSQNEALKVNKIECALESKTFCHQLSYKILRSTTGQMPALGCIKTWDFRW
jgi:hypothetical protein